MDLPKSVLMCIQKLVPATILNEISSFRLVPDIPRLLDQPDIIVSTRRGEFMEIKNRIPIYSCILDDDVGAEEIFLHYHGDSLNYVARSNSQVFIVGRDQDDLKIINKFNNVTKVRVDDFDMSGCGRVNIWTFDSLIPTVLDENYEINMGDAFNTTANRETVIEDERGLSILAGKLSEARLNTARNMKTLTEKRELRQKISHISIEESRYNLDEIEENKSDPVFDKLNVGKIWQRIHDDKWIIGIPLENISERNITDIDVLLKSQNSEVFDYKMSTYVIDNTSPFFWSKSQFTLSSKMKLTAVIITSCPIFKISSKIKYKCAISYKFEEKIYCIPIKDIKINAIDIVNGSLNPILCPENNFGSADVLTMFVVSLINTFTIHFVMPPENAIVTFLQDKLGYDGGFTDLENILRHSKSSLHILHGTIINILYKTVENRFTAEFNVLTRSSNQLLMLINLIYDLYPSRIVIAPSSHSVELKKTKNIASSYSDQMVIDSLDSPISNYLMKTSELSSVMYNQMTHVYEYLENCIETMSKNSVQKNKPSNTSMDIDVLVLGPEAYTEFWKGLDKLVITKNKLLKDVF